MYAVKFTEGSEDTIEGWGMPFGGPFNGQDLAGEHFSKSTDFCFDLFPADGGRPLMYHHGLDKDAGVSAVGRVKGYEVKADLGVWVQAQLDRSNEYFSAIKDLVKAGALFFSSGAMPHLVEVDRKSGEIKKWPWVELSTTPSPCNPTATLDFATAGKHYEMAGIKAVWDEKESSLRAQLDADARNSLSDGDFAYIDSEGGRHLPINDEAHCRNAIARFNQTQFESDAARATARRKILAKAKELGIEVSEDAMKAALLAEAPGFRAAGSFEELRDALSDLLNPADPLTGERPWDRHIVATYPERCLVQRFEKSGPATYWMVPYTVGADGTCSLGEPEQVEQTFVPVRKERPVALMAWGLSIDAASLLESTKGYQQRRLKEGRVISSTNRARLASCVEAMTAAVRELQGLLDSTTPAPREGTEGPTKAADVQRRLALLRLYYATLPSVDQ